MGLIYQDTQQPVPPGERFATTAGEVNALLMHYITLAVDVGRTAGVRAVAGPQYEAGVKAGAQAGAIAGARAAVGPAAAAGVKAGAEYAIANSVVRRRVERDERGQVIGSVEQRVPAPERTP